MFRSWPRMRAGTTGTVSPTRLAVLASVLATAWTATIQPTYVAQVDDGTVPMIDTATAGLTPSGAAADPRSTASTSSTGSTGLTFTVIPVSLTIAKSHTGTFTRGEDGVYTIAVGNLTTASPTNGTTVTVHDILPAGLRAERITGGGWHCIPATLTCTRSDILPAGHSYPPVTLKVEVSCDARARVTNTATVTGGGDTTTHTATDTTTIKHDGDDWHDGHHDRCDRHDR